MHISKLSLVNYRNFQNSYFLFKKWINTIIGENGSGKSNVFRALRLFLEDSFYAEAFRLDNEDFNRNLGDWRGHWIIISMEFDDIPYDEAVQAIFLHGTGNVSREQISKATYTLYFRPRKDILKKLSELPRNDILTFETLRNTISILDYETVFVGKSDVDFNDPEIYKELVGDFENTSFPSRIDESKFWVKIPHQLSISKEVSFTFIKALRDVVADFYNNKTNPLLTLLRGKSGEIDPVEYTPIQDAVKSLNEKIEWLSDVKEIRKDIRDTIKDAVGETYAPSSLSIKSSLDYEADKLLQSLKLYIGEPGETYEGRIDELSLGWANLIFLTLKLLEYKYRKSRESCANFLIIEEPEAHIHTHIQRTLFDKLDYTDTQIIYSTHSTHISEVCDVSNMNILGRRENFAEVFQPSTGLPPENIKSLERYLDAVRSNLLFAKWVLLVEGDAEEIIIPILIKKVFWINLDELGLSLINIRSTWFENVAQIFDDQRIRRRCSIITDSDTEIADTTPCPTDDDTIKEYKLKMKRSADSGIDRMIKLDTAYGLHSWIKPFYADHTFEVDFLKSGNIGTFVKLIDIIYVHEWTKQLAKIELESGDIAQYGKRALTMANSAWKGWLAILLGNYIDFNTIVPGYIIDALIFAKGKFTTEIIHDIVSYWLTQSEQNYLYPSFVPLKAKLAQFKQKTVVLTEIITEMESIVPNEHQMIVFLRKIVPYV